MILCLDPYLTILARGTVIRPIKSSTDAGRSSLLPVVNRPSHIATLAEGARASWLPLMGVRSHDGTGVLVLRLFLRSAIRANPEAVGLRHVLETVGALVVVLLRLFLRAIVIPLRREVWPALAAMLATRSFVGSGRVQLSVGVLSSTFLFRLHVGVRGLKHAIDPLVVPPRSGLPTRKAKREVPHHGFNAAQRSPKPTVLGLLKQSLLFGNSGLLST